jgi:hypothetical protein
MSPESSPPTETPESTVWPYIGVGCLTAVVGFFGGGMIAMLIGRITDAFSGCQPQEGFPVCDWWKYWWAGSLMGMFALPFFAVRRLRAARRPSSDSSDSR